VATVRSSSGRLRSDQTGRVVGVGGGGEGGGGRRTVEGPDSDAEAGQGAGGVVGAAAGGVFAGLGRPGAGDDEDLAAQRVAAVRQVVEERGMVGARGLQRRVGLVAGPGGEGAGVGGQVNRLRRHHDLGRGGQGIEPPAVGVDQRGLFVGGAQRQVDAGRGDHRRPARLVAGTETDLPVVVDRVCRQFQRCGQRDPLRRGLYPVLHRPFHMSVCLIPAQLVDEQIRVAGGVGRAMEIGVVDEVVAPADTRKRIAEALAAAPPARGGAATCRSRVVPGSAATSARSACPHSAAPQARHTSRGACCSSVPA
jgi:hypothetical protein